MIQRLGSDVISELRSGVALSSLSQCVEELVLNSIDAGSSSITVDLDMSTISLEVSDNGTGMRQGDLKNVGQRYFTSKCHSLHDLGNLASYGFRGEALASLSKICEKVEIVSRHKTSGRTFCKCVRKGWDMGVYESTSLRPRHGTTIKAFGVFYALPVRQKLISEKVDLEQIRRHVLGIALMNLGVSFLVRNKVNATSMLHINACNSVSSVISQVFSCSKSKAFKSVFLTSGAYTITGYISLEGYPCRNFQFFYINKQLVLKTKFHHVTNHILGRAVTGLLTTDHESINQGPMSCSPKRVDRHAGFVINLECPYNSYDITFDPKKTLVEFQNWDEPISCLKRGLLEFLKKEGIFNDKFLNTQFDSQELCPGLPEVSDLVKLDSESSIECPSGLKRSIKASDLRRSLCSSAAKRKRNENATCNIGSVYSSSDLWKSNESSSGTKMERTIETEVTVLSDDCPSSSTGFSTSSKDKTFPYSRPGVSVLNKVRNSSKRSIIAKLERRSSEIPRPSNISPADSNRIFSSTAGNSSEQLPKNPSRIRYKKVESVKLKGVEGDCSEMSGGDACSERKIFPPEPLNDSRTPLAREHHEIVNAGTTTSTKDKLPIKDARNVYFQTVNGNVISSFTTDHCSITSMVGANIVGNNPRLHKDSRIPDYDKESSDFFSEATANMSIGDSGMAKADTSNPISCDNVESAPLKDSDWLLQHNPRDGRPLYVNLRTGNTSVAIPHTKPPPREPLLKNQSTSMEQTVDSTKLRPFRNYASHISHNFTPWLPRSIAPSQSCNMSKGEEKQATEIRDMFDQWVNPVFARNEKLVMDASFTHSSKTSVKVHNTLQPFKFTKDCFSKMKVINQVDEKFILCYYKGNEENEDSFLVVVDQHAAHERVRLETFIKELYADSQDPGEKIVMKSSPLPTPCQLFMSDHDVHLMQAFRVQLARLGITFEDPARSSSDIQSSVCIKTVPSVFHARERPNDGEELRVEIKNCIEDLIKEQIEAMLSTKGISTTALPKAITKVLNSHACHGAIRFGDSLSTKDCVSLMSSLSMCDLPFQCAHGRPSMIPLINTKLTQNGTSKKASSLPQISRIRKLIKGKII